MRVTRVTVSQNVALSVGFLLIVRLAAAQDSQDKSFYGIRNDKWRKWWLPDPLKIGRFRPLKNADVTFHNQTSVNVEPPDNIPAYYTYGYRIYEPKAGEFKDHKEFRNGGLIHGSLKVIEKTGANTNITYEGLPWSGWQALIETRDSAGEQLANDMSRTSSTTTLTATLTTKLDFTGSATSEASSQQKSTETTAKMTIDADFASSTETPYKQNIAKTTSEKMSTVMPSKLTSTKFNRGPTLASKMARYGSQMTSKRWIQIYRICPVTDPSFIKTPNLLCQVAQSWHTVQSPQPEKMANSSWQTHHQMSSTRRSDGRMPMPTQHSLHQPFRHVFSARPHLHKQPSESLLEPMSAPKRKRYSIHHKKPTWKRLHHSRYQRRSNFRDQDVSHTV